MIHGISARTDDSISRTGAAATAHCSQLAAGLNESLLGHRSPGRHDPGTHTAGHGATSFRECTLLSGDPRVRNLQEAHHVIESANERKFQNGQIRFRWSFLPWLTITTCAVLWAIHLAISLLGSPQAVRAEYGLAFDRPLSYLPHAFIHDAGFGHLVPNTLILLFFGPLAEVQAGRRWYGMAVLSGILAGVAGTYLLQVATGMGWDEKGAGFSAATSALSVLAVGALVYQWRWGRPIFIGSVSGLWILLLIQPEAVRRGEVLWLVAALVPIIVGIGAVWYWFIRGKWIPVGLTPLLWVLLMLIIDLFGVGWTYSAAGHLGGMMAGALLIRPALHRKSPTLATTWTKEVLCRVCLRLWGPVQRPIPRGWLFGMVTAGLLAIAVVVWRVAGLPKSLLDQLTGN